MTPFAVTAPRQTLFGRGCRSETAAQVARRGRRVLLLRGRSVRWVDTLIAELEAAELAVLPLYSGGEPSLDQVRQALAEARPFRPDCVVAVGGGATIDLAKAVAALIRSDDDPAVHLEGAGGARPIGPDPLPVVAVPTTAGTGAEATRNAVITLPESGLKVSLRDDRMVPDLAIVDPALTDGAPRALTLATGLDAITQLIESYLSIRANPVTDALCRATIPGAVEALSRLMEGEDAAARDSMARASYLSGIALANAGLGIVHGLAAVIGAGGGAHGAICGRLLPAALSVNQQAVRARGMDDTRFREVDQWLAEGLGVAPGAGCPALGAFIDRYGLDTLAGLGCPPGHHDAVARQAIHASSTRSNPVSLEVGDVNEILAAASGGIGGA